MLKRFQSSALIAICSLVMLGCSPAPDTSHESDKVKNTDFGKFKAYTQKFTEDTVLKQSHATGHVGNFFFTHWKDGGTTTQSLGTNGEFSVEWTKGDYNFVGGPGWHYGDKDRVIGFRIDEDSGANFVTLYGWGYDKNMSRDDPNHLVEYYVLQRWVSDPSQEDATFGKTFVSNGIEYSSYRKIRVEKPSINSISTFYQYYSIPSEQIPLGQESKIVFADHVNAWADSGWIIPNMDNVDASDDPTYQVMAVEVFGPLHDGVGAGQVWDASSE